MSLSVSDKQFDNLHDEQKNINICIEEVFDKNFKLIETEKLDFHAVDTVTLYLNPKAQQDYYDYILSLKPRRVIFNPGTENSEFRKLAEAHGIQCEEACTLVLLNTNQY